jgi:7-cyano-7-deazaguanine synthase
VKRAAVILLSGGLDSATTLAWARAKGFECYALSVAYGQRHSAELNAAARLAETLGARDHRTISVDLGGIGGSALTDLNIAIPEVPSQGIPVTYVPARNTLLLALALGWAEVLRSEDIFIGANAVDFSGYPDCRTDFISAFERVAAVGTRAGVEGHPCRVHAPLISWTKAQIISEGVRLGVDFGVTVSCYQADDLGRACGRCDSCRIRKSGFEVAGVPDPTRYQAV